MNREEVIAFVELKVDSGLNLAGGVEMLKIG